MLHVCTSWPWPVRMNADARAISVAATVFSHAWLALEWLHSHWHGLQLELYGRAASCCTISCSAVSFCVDVTVGHRMVSGCRKYTNGFVLLHHLCLQILNISSVAGIYQSFVGTCRVVQQFWHDIVLGRGSSLKRDPHSVWKLSARSFQLCAASVPARRALRALQARPCASRGFSRNLSSRDTGVSVRDGNISRPKGVFLRPFGTYTDLI